MLEVVPQEVYGALHGIYYEALRGRVKARMRPPTVGEIKLFDREIHLNVIEEMQQAD